MKLRVRSFIKNPIKYDEKDIEVPLTINGNDAITIIKNSFEITESNDSLCLLVTLFTDFNNPREIKKESLLSDFNIKENDILSLKYPDSFFSINLMYSIVIAYLGPVIMSIFLAFNFGLASCGVTQILIMFMSNFHYIRRMLETSIDIRGNDKINFFMFLGTVGYYWFLYGYLVLANIFHESYNLNNNFLNGYLKGFCVLAFLYSEFRNYTCHNILRNLKVKNRGKRGIPLGGMFNYVSCANYYWELLSWLFFGLFANSLNAYLFIIYSFVSMTYLAIEKHKTYIKNFDDYPKSRKAIIPFIL